MSKTVIPSAARDLSGHGMDFGLRLGGETEGSASRYTLNYVYILTNVSRNVMYIGVTNDLERRLADHGDGRGGSFTRRYRVNTLVHVEEFQFVDEAIAREKQIKGWSRTKKDALVQASNPTWADLSNVAEEKGPSLRSG